MSSIYGERIMREIGEMEGVKIRGVNVNNVRYADNTVLVEIAKRGCRSWLTEFKK